VLVLLIRFYIGELSRSEFYAATELPGTACRLSDKTIKQVIATCS